MTKAEREALKQAITEAIDDNLGGWADRVLRLAETRLEGRHSETASPDSDGPPDGDDTLEDEIDEGLLWLMRRRHTRLWAAGIAGGLVLVGWMANHYYHVVLDRIAHGVMW